MNFSDERRKDLYDLLELLCTNEIDQPQLERLQTIVLESNEARDLYLEAMQIHRGLEWLFRDPEPNAAIPSPVLSKVEGPALPALSKVEGSPRLRFSPSTLAWSILAASLLFAAYFVGISWDMLGKDLSGRVAELQSPLAPDKAPKGYPGVGGEGELVATIRGTDNVEWSKDDQSPLAPDQGRGAGGEGSAIAQNQPLSIHSGLIELQLTGGTTLLIEGPANWKINGDNSATLTRGKLVAKVPQQAIGFTLATPTARIVDLGTEFGVEVAQGGTADVQVLKGLVDVQAGPSGKGNKPIRLKAGEGVRINTNGTQSSVDPENNKKFKRLAEGKKNPVEAQRSSATRLIDLSKDAVARQSSEFGAARYPASNAIDGNRGTFSHTSLAGDRAPWWQVDLGSARKIAAVMLLNRQGSGKSRLRNITITILGEDGVTVVARSSLLNPGNEAWGGLGENLDGPEQLDFNFTRKTGEPVIGRFVRVERTSKEEDRGDYDRGVPLLLLAEVQVFVALDSH